MSDRINTIKTARRAVALIVGCCLLLIGASLAMAQLPTAAILGVVKDSSGAVIPGASLTATNVETGQTRTTVSGADGSYRFAALPVGSYELRVEHPGFQSAVHSALTLTVAQEAVVNIALQVGAVEQTVAVTAEAPLVNTTVSSTSGLVGERQVKDLPLNGRSFDQLLTLNVGTANYSTNYHTTGSAFSVAGHRPESNRFIVNGMDYIGTDNGGNAPLPTGASGALLGVDAVREFNVQQDSYGAEYGKRSGGQISIVTSSGTNRLHGEAFEFLRNNVLDARNFFDFPQGRRIPKFERNQFGGVLGGPLKKDQLFLFGNYEGLRQRLGLSQLAFVPDANARQGRLPIGPNNTEILVPGLKPGILPFLNTFWPSPNGRALGGGVAEAFSNPVQRVRDDFGLIRLDYNVSSNDSLSGTYLIDDGENDSPTFNNPNFIEMTPQRNQLTSVQETHIFSSRLLNVLTGGYSRAFLLDSTFATVPFPSSLNFVAPGLPGSITIAGGIGGFGGASAITAAGGSGPIQAVRNLFHVADDVHYTSGKHSLSMGVWVQRNQQNLSTPPIASTGSVSYLNLQNFLVDNPIIFQAIPFQTPLGFRTTQAAWYVQDEIKLKPNLTVRLGVRDEITSGLDETHRRAANYLYDPNGQIISPPLIGRSAVIQNNGLALWEPRVGIAWDPTGSGKWSVRAGFGIHHDLPDNIGTKVIPDPPFNSRVSFPGVPLLSFIPLSRATPPLPPCSAELRAANQPCGVFVGTGIEPTFNYPTTQQWSFTMERGITPNLLLRVGYVGSQSYHIIGAFDMNVPVPVVCQSPAGCASGGVLGPVGHVPQGTRYLPPGPRPNPLVANTISSFFNGTSNYNALDVTAQQRSSYGLTLKASYTYSKILDLNSATIAAFLGINEPQNIQDRYDLGLSRGPAAYNLKHVFTANFTYELPFGSGKPFAGGVSGWENKLVSGWQWNGVVSAQSGFPFTPIAGSNISGNGDPTNSDVVSRNPNFTGPVILGKVNQWFNPQAFSLPIPGTFGNAGRGQFEGPALATFDTSVFKTTKISERFNLEFRAEAFNLFNSVNFATPNPVVFQGANISSSAGRITNTSTASRQIQFALKLLF